MKILPALLLIAATIGAASAFSGALLTERPSISLDNISVALTNGTRWRIGDLNTVAQQYLESKGVHHPPGIVRSVVVFTHPQTNLCQFTYGTNLFAPMSVVWIGVNGTVREHRHYPGMKGDLPGPEQTPKQPRQ